MIVKIQRANIHGQILKWARESMNLTAEEAAKRIGVPCSRLESWERDEAKPTVRQAREASRIYRRPLAVFFLKDPPRDFHVPHDFRRVPGEVVAELPPEFMRAGRFDALFFVDLPNIDERVTGINDVVLSSDGDDVEAVLVDVGGFLGLFTHTVFVSLEQLDVQRDAEQDEVRVYLDLSQEQLESLPEHEG